MFRVGLGLALAAALVVQTGLAGVPEDQEEKIRETYRALAVTLGGIGLSGPSRTRLTISIDRWTTDEEHNQLITTLAEKGSKDFLNALQKQEGAGFVQFATLTIPLRYAREIRVEGKRIIRLATGDPIFSYLPRTLTMVRGPPVMLRYPRDFTGNYPFSLIELRLDENNEGEGTLCEVDQIKYDKKNTKLLVESLSSDPMRLTGITKTN